MKRFIFYIGLLLLCCVSLTAQSIKIGKGIEEYTAEERPWIWWFWLGNIVSEDLIDQHLTAYSKAGYGGVVVISTYGVKGYEQQQIQYRSSEWYKMIQYVVRKADQLGMKVDIALSSAWPFGGKQVNRTDGARFLKRLESFKASQHINKKIAENDEYVIAVSAFSAENVYMDLTTAVDSVGNLCTSLPEGNWRIEVVIGGFTNQKVKRSSPGGDGLVLDNFDKNALKRYLIDFEKDLKDMKGIRALFNDSYEVYGADYTPTFITEFEKRRGYSPKPFLSILFKEEKNELAERFLCDYRATMAELILENFVQEWTNWSNNHFFKTIEQAHGSPSNVLDMYAASDIPQCESFGPSCFDIDEVRIDVDTKREVYKRPDILHMKFSSSAGNLKGRPLISSETATWLTNHFRTTLSQVKPEVNKLFIAGINHIHMVSSTNTPLDSPYPGWVFYPAPDFGPRSSLIDYIPDFNLYVSRVQNVLQQSKSDNDILLYWPVYDYFSETKKDLGVLTMMDHIPTKWGDNWPFAVTARRLKDAGYQFDYVSDKLLSQMTIENGMLKSESGNLYKVVVVPACKRIPIKTMENLHALAKRGVKIVFDKKMPNDVPGLYQVSARLQRLFMLCNTMKATSGVFISNDIDSVLQELVIPKVGFPLSGLEFIRKKISDGRIFFIANQKNIFQNGEILLDHLYHTITAYDPMTGKLFSLESKNRDGKSTIKLQLLPGQSIILFADCSIIGGIPYECFDGVPIPLNLRWEINFEKNESGAPFPIVTDKLMSWTELGDSTHCFYSGTGVYQTVFDLPKSLEESERIRMKFANICDMAEVFVNNKSVGRVWAVPYQLDIDAKLFKKKGNTLRIEVQNIATNRIIGMDRHQIKWQECYISDPKRGIYDTANWELLPSGLIGDICLIGIK